jgi:hypothetical protein
MYWTLVKIVLLSLYPCIPVNPKITRPDPGKNVWTFCCDGWTSFWQLGRTKVIKRA